MSVWSAETSSCRWSGACASRFRCLWTVQRWVGTSGHSAASAFSRPAAPSTIRNSGVCSPRATRSSRSARQAASRNEGNLGLMVEQTEGAKFWLQVMNELKSRGVEDVLIAVGDGLKGFPEAITATFPQAQVQTCVDHLSRRSRAFVSYKDRKAVAAALKQIYKAKDADAGKLALEDFDESPRSERGDTFPPTIARSSSCSWC